MKRCILITALAVSLLSLAVATSAAGTPATARLVPRLGHSVLLTLRSGTVSVRRPGTAHFLRLHGTILAPNGTDVDATDGRVAVTVAAGRRGSTHVAVLSQGIFVVHQSAVTPFETRFALSQRLTGCTATTVSAATARRGRSRPPAAKARHLWAQDNGGSFGTTGRYVSTTVEGTRWLTADQCARSTVSVAQGAVAVTNLVTHQTVTVTAGQSYAATPTPTPVAPPAPKCPVPPITPLSLSGAFAAAFSPDVLSCPSDASFTVTIPDQASGALPPPLASLNLTLPQGAAFSVVGDASCSVAVVQAAVSTPPACPPASLLGTGSATIEALIGATTLVESMVVELINGGSQNGTETIFAWMQGDTPIAETYIATGAYSPIGVPALGHFTLDTPGIPTVPGGPNTSFTQLSLTFDSRTTAAPLVYEPTSCPAGGFGWGIALSFEDGSSSAQAATSPCP